MYTNLKTVVNDRATLKYECVTIGNEDISCFGNLANAMLVVDNGFCNLFIAGVGRDFEWTMEDFKTKKPRWIEICEYMVERYGKDQVQEIQVIA